LQSLRITYPRSYDACGGIAKNLMLPALVQEEALAA
jgi:hypothetical protein